MASLHKVAAAERSFFSFSSVSACVENEFTKALSNTEKHDCLLTTSAPYTANIVNAAVRNTTKVLFQDSINDTNNTMVNRQITYVTFRVFHKIVLQSDHVADILANPGASERRIDSKVSRTLLNSAIAKKINFSQDRKSVYVHYTTMW